VGYRKKGLGLLGRGDYGMQTRGLFFKPGFTGLTAFKPGYPGLTYGGSLVSGYKSCTINSYAAVIWKCGWLDT